MTNSDLIQYAKLALRVNTSAYDNEISQLINAALIDLKIAGVKIPEELDAIVSTAVITYVRLHFGQPEDYDRVKRSYDEQKAQLKTATGWAEWSGGDV